MTDEQNPQVEEDPEKLQDRLLRLIVSEDRLHAFVSVSRKSDRKKLTEQDLAGFIERKGVVFGVKRARVKGLLRKLKQGDEVVRYQVAEGLAAKRGKDSVLTLRYDTSLAAGAEQEEGGRMAYRERGYVNLVKRGQLLFDLVPAGEGTPGKSVTGEELPAQRGRTSLPGELVNVYDEEGLRWYAAVDGLASCTADRVVISEEIHIAGDVDYGVGNLDYDGPVTIDGTVRRGFRIASRSAIVVGGDVEADAVLECDGSIEVRGRICSGERGLVRCAGALKAQQILDSRVEVGGDAEIGWLVLGSQVVCRGRLTMTDQEAEIRGGQVEAVEGLTVGVAGSPSGTRTVLVSGVTLAWLEESKQVAEDAGELGRRIDAASQGFQQRYAGADAAALPAGDRERYLDARGRVDELQTKGMARLGQLKQRRQELREKFAQSEEETMIKVLQRVLPGVVLCIGHKARLEVKEEIERETFYQQAGQIRRLSEG